MTPTETATPTSTPSGYDDCINAGAVYDEPVYDLESINLGPVSFLGPIYADESTGTMDVIFCTDDPMLDISIGSSPANALRKASFTFSPNVCQGLAPERVEITLQHFNSCTVEAFDETGAPVDQSTASPDYGPQTLVLESPNGIRKVEFTGAEICVMEICWICEGPLDDCINASDVYAEPAYELETVGLGALTFLSTIYADESQGFLSVIFCNDDPMLDISIPSSPSNAIRKTQFYFSPNVCEGNAPQRVEIVLQHFNSCFVQARSPAGAIVDQATATPDYGPQTLVLESPVGINTVEFIGAEICVLEVCWQCVIEEPTPTLTPTPSASPTTEPSPTFTMTETVTPTVTPTSTHSGFEDCVDADDLFDDPVYDLESINLGPVVFLAPIYVDETSGTLSVFYCNDDMALDIGIGSSPSSAIRKASFSFSPNVCGGSAPQRVEVIVQHYASCALEAFDDAGTLVDSATASPDYGPQVLILESPTGIRTVEFTGAEICVLEICWACDSGLPTNTPTETHTEIPQPSATFTETPSPTATATSTPVDGDNCIKPDDVFDEPVSNLEIINMGVLDFEAPIYAYESPGFLNVTYCNDDEWLDISIGSSPENALRKASLTFSPNLCLGSAPQRVEITIQHFNSCSVRAYDDSGTPVDQTTASPDSATQTLVLESTFGIRTVEFTGAEICVLEICWFCESFLDDCIRPGDVFQEPAFELEDINLGLVNFLAPIYVDESTGVINLVDCNNDEMLDISIGSSPANAIRKALFEFSPNVCRGSAPQYVEITLQHFNSCSVEAYDDAGNMVDQASATAGSELQTLVLESSSGIRAVEFTGAEICVVEICWICEMEEVTPTWTPTLTPTETAQPSPTFTATRTNTPVFTPSHTATWTPTATPTISSITMTFNIFPYQPVRTPLYVVQQPVVQIAQDVYIEGVEVTQGIQHFDSTRGVNEPDNTVPLVIGKSTAIRIYLGYWFGLDSVDQRDGVPVRLYYRFGLGDWHSKIVTGPARTTLDQSDAANSANAFLTINSLNDSVAFSYYAIVDPADTIDETNEDNNRFPAEGHHTLTFHKRRPLKIIGERLDYHPTGYTGTRHAGGWAVNGGGAQWYNQLLPVADGAIDYSVASGYLNWTTSLNNSDGQHALIRYLNGLWVLGNLLSILVTGEPSGIDHIYGWAPHEGYSGGHADMPMYPHAGGLGVVAIGGDEPGTSTDDPERGAIVFGHEISHDYDVQHTDTGGDDCGANDPSSDFPYGTSSIQEFGFNPITNKVYHPNTTHDLMSYCPPDWKEGWISPFHWTKLFNALAPEGGAKPLPVSPDNLPPMKLVKTLADTSLVVSARIENPTSTGYFAGSLKTLYKIGTGGAYVLPAGDYAIELRNGESVLSRREFLVDFSNDHETEGEEEKDEFDHAYVTMALPWDASADKVVLLNGQEVLDQRPLSANAPTVTITSPDAAADWTAGATETIEWDAQDLDGDDLVSNLYYSPDGGENWDLLATEIEATSFDVAVDSLRGSTQGYFRVITSDGIHTTIDESDQPVTVPFKEPMASILNPDDGGSYMSASLVILRGMGVDFEDGNLSGSSLQWSSDSAGPLGSGTILPINTLETGTHVITLTATDNAGQSATDSVTVNITSSQAASPDLNQDGYVNHADLLQLFKQWGHSVEKGYPPSFADLDIDGDVDAEDMFMLQMNWGPLE
jgi:hypothetical protein